MTDQLALKYDDLDPHEARVLSTLRAHRGRRAAIRVPELALQVGIGKRQVQTVMRRLCVEHGVPILSGGSGVWLASTADELIESYREQRRKAISTLMRQRAIYRRHLARLRGQQEIAA